MTDTHVENHARPPPVCARAAGTTNLAAETQWPSAFVHDLFLSVKLPPPGSLKAIVAADRYVYKPRSALGTYSVTIFSDGSYLFTVVPEDQQA